MKKRSSRLNCRSLPRLLTLAGTTLLLITGAQGETVSLVVTADAHIDGTNVTSNFGTNDILSIEQTVLGGNKAYLKFDASSFGITNLARVESLRFFWSASTGITRTLSASLITGPGTTDWTETGITWENAPGNNVTGTLRGFTARPGETVTPIGNIQYSAGNARELKINFAELSTEEYMLLEALNSGNRVITIGINYSSSQNTSVGIYAREREEGIYAASLQVVPGLPAGTPVSFVTQPKSVTVTNGPYKTVTFTAEASGSPIILYQWLTNGVVADYGFNKSLTLPVDTTNLNGLVVRVQVDNDATADPGLMSSNAVLTIVEPLTPDGTLAPYADVFYNGEIVNNAAHPSSAMYYGLLASGGYGATVNRSFLGFNLGNQPVSDARLKIFNYWGGPAVNGTGKLAGGQIRVYGSTNAMLLVEPPAGTSTNWTNNVAWAPPEHSSFAQITPLPDQTVGTDMGWYEFDITSYYNAHLGQQVVLRLSGIQLSGFDYPVFEDRENTAYNGGSAGTWPNSGPKIDFFLGPPRIASVKLENGQLVFKGTGGKNASKPFNLVGSSNHTTLISTWSTVASGNFDANATFSISIPYAPGTPQMYYAVKVP